MISRLFQELRRRQVFKVAAAYGFVWVAVLGYVWSIASRLKQVEAELTELESRKR